MMTEARDEAKGRMVDEATQLGVNAVINIRFATADVVGAGAELLAYGTAVVVQPAR